MWTFFAICGSIGFVLLLILFAQTISTLLRNFYQSSNRSTDFSQKTVLRTSGSLSPPHNKAWLLTALLTSQFGYIILLALGRPFDRYLLPLYPLTLILACIFVSENSDFDLIGLPDKALTLFLISLFAYFSVASTHDFLAWNRARWQALNELTVVQKISPKLIDGGYEFNSWRLADRRYKQKPNKSFWWVDDDNYVGLAE
jgi:hypothetical protein